MPHSPHEPHSSVKIGAFRTDMPLILEWYPNGGWIIRQGPPEQGMMGTRLGAYGSAKEMLDALRSALVN